MSQRAFNIFFAIIMSIALYLWIGGAFASLGARNYVKSLQSQGVICKELRTDGPSHTHKSYWECDNGEKIVWWGLFNIPTWWKHI